MRAGALNRMIVIEYPSEATESGYGTKMVAWLPLDVKSGSPTEEQPISAEVQDALPSRSESVRQGLAVARNQTRIRMRWRNDLTSKMRIKVLGDTNVYYQIVGGPAEIGSRKDGIEIVCEKYSSGGA
jgi:head-tail adaptor